VPTISTTSFRTNDDIYLYHKDGIEMCGTIVDVDRGETEQEGGDAPHSTVTISVQSAGDGKCNRFVAAINDPTKQYELLLSTVDNSECTVDDIHVRTFHLWRNMYFEIIPVFIKKFAFVLNRINNSFETNQNICLHYKMILNGKHIHNLMVFDNGVQRWHDDMGTTGSDRNRRTGTNSCFGEQFVVVD